MSIPEIQAASAPAQRPSTTRVAQADWMQDVSTTAASPLSTRPASVPWERRLLAYLQALIHPSHACLPLQDYLRVAAHGLQDVLGCAAVALIMPASPKDRVIATTHDLGTAWLAAAAPALVSSTHAGRLSLPEGICTPRALAARSALSLPISADGHYLGHAVVFFAAATPPVLRSRSAQQAVDAAERLGHALQAFLLSSEREQRSQRVQEARSEMRSFFGQVGACLSSALQVQPLLRLLLSLCVRMSQAHSGSLQLQEGGKVRYRVSQGFESTTTPRGMRMQQSLVGWAPLTESPQCGDRQTLLPRRDATGTSELLPTSPASAQIRSVLCLPLYHKETLRGHLSLHRHDMLPFSEEDVSLLTGFSSQAAAAIDNALHFEAETQRAREATLLYRAARSIAVSTSLDELLDTSARQLLRVTDTDRCLIYLAGERNQEFRLARGVGVHPEQAASLSQHVLLAGTSAHGVWDELRAGRHRYLSGSPVEAPAIARILASLHSQAALLVPLLNDQRLVGLIILDDSRMSRFFDESQVRMVMTLSLQVASAIEKARLLHALESNLHQVRALHEVSKAISGTLSLQRVLDLVMEKACELLGIPACSVLALPGSKDTRGLEGYRGLPASLASRQVQLRIAQPAMQRKRISAFYQQGGVERGREGGKSSDSSYQAHLLEDSGLGGVMVVPLLARQRLVGVLSCYPAPHHTFTADDMRLIRGFANQAAAAVENARLHELVQSRMLELSLLNETSQALSSTLDLDTVLRDITSRVKQAMQADACAIMLIEPLKGQLVIKTALGLGPGHESRVLPRDRGFIGRVNATRRPVLMVDDGSNASQGFPKAVRREGLRTVLAVPMLNHDKLVGLIHIYHREEHTYEPGHLKLLSSLSSQAAVAIENASLYQDRHQVAEMLRRLLQPRDHFNHGRLDVGHRFLPSLELSGDYFEMVETSADRAALFMADVAGKGPRAAMYAVRAKYALSASIDAGLSPQESVRTLNRIIAPESEPDMFITLFHADIDTQRGSLRFTSAGHEPPILYRSRSRKARHLTSRDMVVGLFSDVEYHQHRVRVEANDLLVLYTDGVTEARGRGAERYGSNRLRALVESSAHLAAQQLADHITEDVLRHTRSHLDDDFSLLVLRVR